MWWPAVGWLLFSIVGLGGSLFFGIWGREIFTKPVEPQPSRPKRYAQFILNFFGAAFGWAALAALIEVAMQSEAPKDFWGLMALLAIALVAFLGITGHLPYAVIQKVPGLFGKRANG